MHHMQSLVERAKKKRAIIDTHDLDNFESSMDVEINLGIEKVSSARSFEKELGHLKA